MARTDRRRADRNVVLFVSLSGWLAGPGRSVATLISYLPDRIQPVLACPSQGNLLAAVRAQTPRTEHLRLPRKPGQQSHPWSRIQAAAVLAIWMVKNRGRIMALHANGFSDLHISAPGLLLTRRPVVVWFHGSEQNPWDRALGRIWRRLLPSRRFAAVAEVARDRAMDGAIARREQIELVPNPIDPRDVMVEDAARGKDAREPTVVGYLGGVRRLKGFFQLPDLVDLLMDAPVSWAIFDSPSGKEEQEEQEVWERLRQAGSDRVRIWGRQDDVRNAYRVCDIVIALSAAEAHPRGVAEPMLNRIPVVATDIQAHRALIGDDEGGLLFPLGDLTAASEAIRRLATDTSLRSSLGEAARLRVAESTDPDRIARWFVDSYDSLADGPHVTRYP